MRASRFPVLLALALAVAACSGGTSPQQIGDQVSGLGRDPGVTIPFPRDLGLVPCSLVSAEAVGQALGRSVEPGLTVGATLTVPATTDVIPAGACEYRAGAGEVEGDRVQVRVSNQRSDTVFERLSFRLERQDGLAVPALWQPDAQTVWLRSDPHIVSVQVLRVSAVGDRDAVVALAGAIASRLAAT